MEDRNYEGSTETAGDLYSALVTDSDLSIGERVDRAINDVVFGQSYAETNTIETDDVNKRNFLLSSSSKDNKFPAENVPKRVTRGRFRACSAEARQKKRSKRKRTKPGEMNDVSSDEKDTSSQQVAKFGSAVIDDSAASSERTLPKRTRHEVRFECDRCGLTAKTDVQYLKHRATCQLSTELPPSSEKCGYCDQVLIGEKHAEWHFLNVHPGLAKRTESCSDSHVCPLCSLAFASLNSWLRHVHNHTVQKAFECAICHAKYAEQSDFLTHVLTHPLERTYSCSACPEKFALPIARDTHARNHAQFQCKLCANSYKYQKTLLTHMRRVHSDHELDVKNEPTEEENDAKEAGAMDASEDAAALDDDRDGNWSDENNEEAKEFRGGRTRRKVTYKSRQFRTDNNVDFPCDLCDRTFKSVKSRREHFAKDHNGSISCVPCNLTFNHRRGLRRHRIRCHGPKTKSWVCEVCGKAFDCTYALSTHRRVHFAPKKHACSICGMMFQRAENMRRHEGRHYGERIFMCDCCGACYSTKLILQKHAETHVDPKDKVFLCDTCGAGFSRPNILKWHVQSDCGKKRSAHSDRPLGVPSRGRTPGLQKPGSRQLLPFPCPMCKKGFKEQAILDRHIKGFHTNDQSLICDECGIRFRTEATLNTHKAIHTSLQHKCRFCNKEFLRESLKAIHEREKHTGDRPFKCKFCEESFSRKGKLSAHQLIHYGREIKCDYCGMLFAKVDTKNKHMKKHTNQRPYVCNLCNKAFKEKYNLEIHMRTHSNQKAFVCKICSKRYSEATGLKNHMRTHDQGLAPQYACDICDQLFESSEAQVAHSESHTDQRQAEPAPTANMNQIIPVQVHPSLTTQVQAQVLKPQETVQLQEYDMQGMDALRQQQQPQQEQQQIPQQQQHTNPQLLAAQPHTTIEQRAFEIQIFDQFQRPQHFSLDQLHRVQAFAPDQVVSQRPQATFSVDSLQNVQRSQMMLMDPTIQRPQIWNLNPGNT